MTAIASTSVLRKVVLPVLLFLISCIYFSRLSVSTYRSQTTNPLEPPYRLYNSTHGRLPSTKYAIATFLTSDNTDPNYFTATRILTYQFLHAPTTKFNATTDISFLVCCTSTVPESQKAQLKKDGATVVEVTDVPTSWWISTGVTRWRDQFTKLRLFQMEEYSRILFIDADTMIMSDISPIFLDPEVAHTIAPLLSRKTQIKKDEADLPAEWMFAARSDNALTGEREHAVPPLQTQVFSAGFWMARPDGVMFEYLMSVTRHWRRFDPHTMEQSLLNYAFRREGAMPWRELNWKWSATWPSEADASNGVVTLHEKWWRTGPNVLKAEWQKRRRDMERFFEER
ncbi:nucleotide-diphospho-sugar transferase [Delitschia confertaspora ATCC 74209]|uniref:Nucleotide-diphospho-sugar transferase n=1 Tax=Delitschia confertaspora ATCC 74209 TaxID=1513339 RepID=A0A9P4MLS7_9PLEO|nr:nucleotide-diphospho-sugar transferase [Delitschia confertaspora ATCC 74209]